MTTPTFATDEFNTHRRRYTFILDWSDADVTCSDWLFKHAGNRGGLVCIASEDLWWLTKQM